MKAKTYFLQIYGCQMNYADAERLATVLERLGYQPAAKPETASLVGIVACSVRQRAADRILGFVKSLRRQNPSIKFLLTGCVLPADRKKLITVIDYFLEIKDLAKLPKLLKPNRRLIFSRDYLEILPLYQSKFSVYVPIMTGCNNFCSYCAVPYTRGREVSRPASKVIKEVRDLIKAGYKEITLVGQNVNSYHSGGYNFAKLLKTIDSCPGDYWLSFLTSHPKDLSLELIKVMAKAQHLRPYLHLALQSGDDEILRRMNRKYTAKHFEKIASQVRKLCPSFTLSTDIIVGFPGETKAQFNRTKKVFKAVGFGMAFIAQFSPRPGTAAAKLPDDVALVEKKRRWQDLTNLLTKMWLKQNRALLGKEITVLVEQAQKVNRHYHLSAKTGDYKHISFTAARDLSGQFVRVRVTKILRFGLVAELVK